MLRKGKPLYSCTSHRVENQRKKTEGVRFNSLTVQNISGKRKMRKIAGKIPQGVYRKMVHRAKRKHQVKGMDLNRAMELRINAQKCAINSSSTDDPYREVLRTDDFFSLFLVSSRGSLVTYYTLRIYCNPTPPAHLRRTRW